MRKRSCMGILLVVMIVLMAGWLHFSGQYKTVLKISGGRVKLPYIAIRTEQNENSVQLWFAEEGKGYFFLPAFVADHQIQIGERGVRIDGELYRKGDIFVWEEDRSYQMQVTDANETDDYEVVFMKSENIPAIFIDTESGGLDYLHEDKENEEAGQICVVREDGVTEYRDKLPRISGRGNGTWGYEKKAYAIKLREAYPLCGMDAGKRWRLLALWLEGNRMDNKIAMDIAEELGLKYSPQGTWVDLYLNGEYRGNYLLTESVTVEKGRIEINDLEKESRENVDGGYLLEKVAETSDIEGAGFELLRGSPYSFEINAPSDPSEEQISYIQAYMENIDRLVQNSDSAVWDQLDLESFAKRFLVDEISMDVDAEAASMFFYKEKGDEKIYSGPPWDYDNAFGEYAYENGYYLDYEGSIINHNEHVYIAIDWYQKLYETPELYQCMVEEYTKLLPFFDRLLNGGIDAYKNRIRASVKMDDVRWEENRVPDGGPPRYADYDANARYMEYFIANRVNYLCDRWDIPHEKFAVSETGEKHQVIFSDSQGVVETVEVLDGQTLSGAPSYGGDAGKEWQFRRSGEPYSEYIPIYEDMELYHEKQE